MAKTDKFLIAAAFLATTVLTGCAAAPAPSQADQANLASCTAQADAVYQQSNLNALGRTSQNGLLFSPTPDHVFDAQRMGTLNAYNNQVSDCVQNGNPNTTPPATTAAPDPANHRHPLIEPNPKPAILKQTEPPHEPHHPHRSQ